MDRVKGVVFWFGLCMAAIFPPLLSLSDRGEAAIFSVVSGIIAMLATRFGDIVMLKFGPLQAELREKIDEADKALELIKELTATTAKTALDLIQSAGRWDGLSDAHTDELYESYKTLLDDLEIDRGPVEAFWHTVIEYDYSLMALGGSTIPTGATADELALWKKMMRGIENRATPEQIRSFLNETGYTTGEREGLVADLEYYRDHHEHRRPDVWAERKQYFVNNPLARPA